MDNYKAEHVRMGLCLYCPNKSVNGTNHCASHLEYKKQYFLEKGADQLVKIRKIRRDSGLCYDCGEPANPGEFRCEKHRLNNLARQQRYRERKGIK